MAKKQQTTRDTSFNYFQDVASNTISSVMSYTATKEFKNIRLLGAEDAVVVTGEKIKAHAAENVTMKELGYDVVVPTDDINSANLYRIYGAPFQVTLNNRQHYNNCGIESTLNTLAMAGQTSMKDNLSDQKTKETDFLKVVWTVGLAEDDNEIGVLDKSDGGTVPDNYKDILAYFDIDSKAYYFSNRCDAYAFHDINELAYKISQGHGAILGVCSKVLWQDQNSETGEMRIDHAIAITGVVYNEAQDITPIDNGDGTYTYAQPVGFYVHDTGAWMSRYISLAEFKAATLYDFQGVDPEEDNYLAGLRDFDTVQRVYIGKPAEGIVATITTEPIKTDMFNLNATGDKQDNTIWGNSGENVIKGMAGNDVLYGNAGDDEIRGGNGNDVIVGNNLLTADKTFIENALDFKLTGIESSEAALKGDNILYGEAGNDIIIGGANSDLIYGGAGTDFIWTGDGRNAAYGEGGNDTIAGGDNIDRLFGDAGNDIIFGFGDDDVLSGGAGNDHLFGGRGNDKIETGAGNDVVYIEGSQHGSDKICAKSGKTTIKFVDEMNGELITSKAVNIMNSTIYLEQQDNNKKTYDLKLSHATDVPDTVDDITFDSFYKSGKTKSLNLVDSDDTTYEVTAKNAKTIKAKTTTNNIIFSLYDKGANIQTGEENDYISIVESDMTSTAYLTRLDRITYTGGQDSYVADEGNTYYTVNEFGEDTDLLIADNVEGLTKQDPITGKIEKGIVSTDDRLYLDCEKDDMTFFFDVALDGEDIKTSDNSGLFILDYDSLDVDKVVDIVSDKNVSGFVYMDSFFGENKEFIEGDFYGNGQIEHIYYQNETPYEDLSVNFVQIAYQVADWLSNSEYSTAFEAFSTEENPDALAELLSCYTVNPMA